MSECVLCVCVYKCVLCVCMSETHLEVTFVDTTDRIDIGSAAIILGVVPDRG